MAKQAPLTQYDFSGGELPPEQYGRTESPRYGRSIAESLNVIPSQEGPIKSRPGTERLMKAGSNVGNSRAIPLEPILGRGFILEFSDNAIRVVKPQPYGADFDAGFASGGSARTVTVRGSGVGSTFDEANGIYIYSHTTDLVEFYRLTVSDTLYYEIDYNTGVLTYDTPFGSITQVDVRSGTEARSQVYYYGQSAGGVDFSAWFSADIPTYGNGPNEDPERVVVVDSVVATTRYFKESEIPDIRYTFSGSTIFLTHEKHAPCVIYRDKAGAWQFADIPFENGPYDPIDPTKKHIQLTMADFVYKLSLHIKGVDFSSFAPGDWISYRVKGEYVLAEFESLDGTETDRAIIKPVKSVVTGLDASAKLEYIAEATPAPQYTNLGIVAASVLQTNLSVFSTEIESSYIRFEDIEATGKGATVKWAKVEKYIGNDTAGSGFYNHGGVNPAEVDIVSINDTVGLITTFTEYGQVDGVSTQPFSVSAGVLNSTSVSADEDLFDLFVSGATSYGRDLGRHIQVVLDDVVMSGYIVADATNTAQKAQVVFDRAIPYLRGEMVNEGIADEWRLGSFYVDNNPTSIGIFAERLVLGGTPSHTKTFWSSSINDYYSHSPRTSDNRILATTAFSITLGGPRLSKIRWIHPGGSQLLIGMEGSIWMVSLANGIYSATTAIPRQQSEVGSILPPVELGSTLFLVNAPGRQIYQIKYDDNAKSFQIDDGLVVPNHPFANAGEEIVELVTQNAPRKILWLRQANGGLVSIVPSWSGGETVYGLTRHSLGTDVAAVDDFIEDELGVLVTDEAGDPVNSASYQSVAIAGFSSVVAMCALYDSSAGREHLYISFSYGPNRYLHRLAFDYNPTAASRDKMLFLDSATIRNSQTAKATWDEFSGYGGEEVTVVADGVLVTKAQVSISASELVLQNPASHVIVGYTFKAWIRSLPFTTMRNYGNNGMQGRILRLVGVLIQLRNTLGISVGTDADNLDYEDFDHNKDIMDGVNFFTGAAELNFHQDRSRTVQYYLEQNDPYPMEIESVTVEAEYE
jgi:hypothetical protein